MIEIIEFGDQDLKLIIISMCSVFKDLKENINLISR